MKYHNKARMIANPATPPTTPPAIAPVFEVEVDSSVEVEGLVGVAEVEEPLNAVEVGELLDVGTAPKCHQN
jgi:hypothetical protein